MPPLHRVVLPVLFPLLSAGLIGLSGTAHATPPPTPEFSREIDDYAEYDGETRCDPTAKPGVVAFRDLVVAAYPQNPDGGISRPCSQATSEHEEGRALDWTVDAYDDAERERAEELLRWLLATDEYGNEHARLRRLGIMYVIFDSQVFKAYRAEEGWQPYIGYSPHTDHVHFSFSVDGAQQRTSWWTAGEDPEASHIDERYRELGGSDSDLGDPTSREYSIAGGRAREYEGGNIYWSSRQGAHVVENKILGNYLAFDGPAGEAGFPRTDELRVTGGRASIFERGRTYWSSDTGAHRVEGKILSRYLEEGGAGSELGLPTTSEYAVPGGRASDFERGRITYDRETGRTKVE